MIAESVATTHCFWQRFCTKSHISCIIIIYAPILIRTSIKHFFPHPLHILPTPKIHLIAHPLLAVRIGVVAARRDRDAGEAVGGDEEGLRGAVEFVSGYLVAYLKFGFYK